MELGHFYARGCQVSMGTACLSGTEENLLDPHSEKAQSSPSVLVYFSLLATIQWVGILLLIIVGFG